MTPSNQSQFEIQVYEEKCIKSEIFISALSVIERRDQEPEMYLPKSTSK